MLIVIGLIFAVIVIVAVVALKGFDQVAGRGPKQISDGIKAAQGSSNQNRIHCPYCAEMIMRIAKKCPFCKSDL